MSYKKIFFLKIFFLFTGLSACGLFSGLLRAEIVSIDKVAAVVNQEVITQTDIDKAIQFFPVFKKQGQSDRDFYLGILDDLVNYKLISLEYSDEVTLREEDYTEVQTSVIKKVGSYDKLIRQLQRWDMTWQDFNDFIREKVIYEKVMQEKFQVKITVNFKEIESFYNEQYLPMQRSLKLKPRTLIEMAPLIENQLRKDRMQEALAQWLKEITTSYKVENKLIEEQ
jgi:hypothetical protein